MPLRASPTAPDKDKWESPPALKELKARCVGPAAGGRVCRVCGVPGDPLTYYAATAGGGIWKSSDGGLSFGPIFDDQPDASVGSIAVAASDPNVIYAGGGEANIRGNVAIGHGIYKSTDAGKNWTQVWKNLGQIGTIGGPPRRTRTSRSPPCSVRRSVRARNAASIAPPMAAKPGSKSCPRTLTPGRAMSPSTRTTRGLFSRDYGKPARKPWELTSGGPGSGLHVSRDGGDSWTQLKPGRARPARRALGQNRRSRWANAVSNSTTSLCADRSKRRRPVPFRRRRRRLETHQRTSQLAATGVVLFDDHRGPGERRRSLVPAGTDAQEHRRRRHFKLVKGLHHGDNHDVWIDPKNPKRMIGGNDGGVDVSNDGGKTWFAARCPSASSITSTATPRSHSE